MDHIAVLRDVHDRLPAPPRALLIAAAPAIEYVTSKPFEDRTSGHMRRIDNALQELHLGDAESESVALGLHAFCVIAS
ncbi:MAG: hypothetical protein AB7V43_14605 [Acidimicrobiia bacterium]